MYSLSSASQRGGHRFVEEVDDDEAAEPPPVPKRREHRHHSSGPKKKKKRHGHRDHHHSHKSEARTPLAHDSKNMKVPDDRGSLPKGSIFDKDTFLDKDTLPHESKNVKKAHDDSPSKGIFVKDVAPHDHRALPSAAVSAAAASSFHEQKAARTPLAPRESKTVKFLDDGNSTKGASEKEFIAPYNQKALPSAAGSAVVAASLQKHAAPALDTAFASAGGVGVATFMEEEEPICDEEETVVSGPARKVGAVAVPGRLAENEYRVSTVSDYSPGEEIASVADPPAQTQPIVATRVTDSEDDIEAQVQSRMEHQARDIAQMVHRELRTNAAVPIDVDMNDNPDERKPVTQGKRRIIIFVSIGLLVILGAVGAAVGVAVSKNKPTPTAPTTSPTTPTPTSSTTIPVTVRFEAFRAVLEPVSGEQFQDTESPQYKALDWIANRDEANLTVGVDSDDSIEMRYAAAVVYYAFEGDGWTKNYNFLSKDHICEWKQEDPGSIEPFGINCTSDNMVDSLRLIRNRLEGSIPREIGYFSNLNNLDLVNNTIRGSLDTLENLTRLENLRLAANQLTGTIPEFLYSHPVLSQLYLDDNRLEGTISSLLGTSTSLKYFWAEGNELVGEIPKALGQTSVLQSIDLGSNRITGSIPEFTTSSLIHLWLASNNLEGPIPTSIGTLSSLKTINLAFNSLAGTIPTELQGCTSLGFMNFQGNHLSGNLGAALDSFPRILESFDVTENQLTGTIPTLIGEFSSLEWFDVGYNKLVGTIPTEVGSLSQLETFYIGHNKISGVIPTSIGMLSKLTFFGIGDNSVVGTLPSEFGLLVELTILGLEYNNLSGVVPTTLANLSKLTKVRLQGNNFTGSVNSLCNSGADFVIFAANTCSDPKQLKCHCCTHCCDPDADQCELI